MKKDEQKKQRQAQNKQPQKLLEEVDEAKELRETLAKCEQERDEYLSGWRRAKADFANFKKDELERTMAVAKFSNEELLRDTLAIVDSFDLAISSEPEGSSAGLRLIRSQLEALLKRYGMEPIESDGKQFDPSLHEAIGEEESKQKTGTIIATIERGWRLYDKVIRASRVRTAK